MLEGKSKFRFYGTLEPEDDKKQAVAAKTPKLEGKSPQGAAAAAAAAATAELERCRRLLRPSLYLTRFFAFFEGLTAEFPIAMWWNMTFMTQASKKVVSQRVLKCVNAKAFQDDQQFWLTPVCWRCLTELQQIRIGGTLDMAKMMDKTRVYERSLLGMALQYLMRHDMGLHQTRGLTREKVNMDIVSQDRYYSQLTDCALEGKLFVKFHGQTEEELQAADHEEEEEEEEEEESD